MKNIFCMILIFIFSVSCGSQTKDLNSYFDSDNPGSIDLEIEEAHTFDPTIDHGKILNYKVTITGTPLTDPIIQYFPVDTEEATFEGFPHGSVIQVMVEALNTNNICVRRGRSEDITIIGGQTVTSILTIYNVPIFANVYDGAIVYNNRFSPKIFAPGQIPFELSDLFNGSTSSVEDQITHETLFSISADISDAILTINAPMFDLGIHELTVQDPTTSEASTVQISVLDGTKQKALTTTAGKYVGTLLSTEIANSSNFILYQQYQTGSVVN